jgi:hypothetical protein
MENGESVTAGVDVQKHHAGHGTEDIHHAHAGLVGATGLERGEVVHEPVAAGHEGGTEGGAGPVVGAGIANDAGDVAAGEVNGGDGLGWRREGGTGQSRSTVG